MEGGVSKFNILTHRCGGFRLDGEGCQYTESVAELAAGATVTTFTARASAVVTTGTAVATFTAGGTTLAGHGDVRPVLHSLRAWAGAHGATNGIYRFSCLSL